MLNNRKKSGYIPTVEQIASFGEKNTVTEKDILALSAGTLDHPVRARMPKRKKYKRKIFRSSLVKKNATISSVAATEATFRETVKVEDNGEALIASASEDDVATYTAKETEVEPSDVKIEG